MGPPKKSQKSNGPISQRFRKKVRQASTRSQINEISKFEKHPSFAETERKKNWGPWTKKKKRFYSFSFNLCMKKNFFCTGCKKKSASAIFGLRTSFEEFYNLDHSVGRHILKTSLSLSLSLSLSILDCSTYTETENVTTPRATLTHSHSLALTRTHARARTHTLRSFSRKRKKAKTGPSIWMLNYIITFLIKTNQQDWAQTWETKIIYLKRPIIKKTLNFNKLFYVLLLIHKKFQTFQNIFFRTKYLFSFLSN